MTESKASAQVSGGSATRSKRLRRRASLVSALSVVASLGLVASAAAKSTSLTGKCGQTLTKPGTYVLQSDVGPCSSTAFTINGNNVTLDLNGYTVSGIPQTYDSSGNITGGYGEGPGIQVVGTSGDVVKNGTVQDFDAGVLLVQSNASPPVPATNDTLTKLNVINNVGNSPPTDFSDGIALIGANNSSIRNNTFTGNGSDAIGLIDSSKNNKIANNTMTNGRGSGVVFSLFDTGNVIRGNTITGNVGTGVQVGFNDSGNVTMFNKIDSNGGFGFVGTFLSDGNIVKHNAITNNAFDGIFFFGSGHDTVIGNTVTGNGTQGAGSGNGDGIFMNGGNTTIPTGNDVVSSNYVANNAGNGIRITCTQDASTGACIDYPQNDTIVQNRVHGNGGSAAGTQVLSGGFLVGVYDLLDGNNPINNAATSPPGTSTPCDSNTWSGNSAQTAYPSCTQGARLGHQGN